jgi:hypothetical protein
MRIIKIDHVISIDQTEYILSLLNYYFGPDVETIKTVTTPICTDSEFEKEWHSVTQLVLKVCLVPTGCIDKFALKKKIELCVHMLALTKYTF